MGNESERRAPGEAEGDGKALHGPSTEVTWDGGRGSQPYANQGREEQGPAAAHGHPAGNRGEASGRNQDQLEQVKGLPARPGAATPQR